jgi:hypothetical protein
VIDRYYFDKTPKGRPDLRGVYVKYLEDFGAGSQALRALQRAWKE